MLPKKPGTAIRHRTTPSTQSETRCAIKADVSAAGAKWFWQSSLFSHSMNNEMSLRSKYRVFMMVVDLGMFHPLQE